MHHPEPDGCISKRLHWLVAVWAGFGGLSHHVSLFSPIWGCLSPKAGIPTTIDRSCG